jgi:hypothetical protein
MQKTGPASLPGSKTSTRRLLPPLSMLELLPSQPLLQLLRIPLLVHLIPTLLLLQLLHPARLEAETRLFRLSRVLLANALR